MPNRILREGILDSEAVNSLSLEAEVFYRRLMSVVDDFGRFEAKIDLIRARCFPLQLDRWPADLVVTCLSDVSKARSSDGQSPSLVSLYTVGGKNYLQINNFQQRTRSTSKYPPSSDGQMTDICPPSARASTPPPPPNTPTSPNAHAIDPEEWGEPTPDDYAQRLIEGDPPARENGLAAQHWTLVDPRLCMTAAREKFIGATNPEALLDRLRASHAAYRRHHETHPRDRGKRLEYWLADNQCAVPPPSSNGSKQTEEW